jgi:hypothetical protein
MDAENRTYHSRLLAGPGNRSLELRKALPQQAAQVGRYARREINGPLLQD